jgi:hypothetical protein
MITNPTSAGHSLLGKQFSQMLAFILLVPGLAAADAARSLGGSKALTVHAYAAGEKSTAAKQGI